MNAISPTSDEREAIQDLHAQLLQVKVVPLEDVRSRTMMISELRRGKRLRSDDKVGLATLVEEDGVWFWEEGMVTQGVPTRRSSGGRRTLFGKKPLTTVGFEKLGVNAVAAKLEELDKSFTPNAGLREFNNGLLTPGAVPIANGRILLFIHGTFSNNDKLFAELNDNTNPDGKQFLAAAVNESDGKRTNYDQVLAFDHCTLSRSPMLNALELARHFASSTADIDIICHSRGGLVTRWFLEVFDHGRRTRRRAVLVGSPLGGTSLAAPDRIRSGIDLFTNVGRVIGRGLSLIPFTQVAGSLLQIGFSIGNFVSKTPLMDAAVSMIPGLSAMSRVENNFELQALRDRNTTPPEYFAITSKFKGDDIGWRFWKVFCDTKLRAAEGAGRLIFRDEKKEWYHNDLVVDTASMTEYGFPPQPDVCEFEEGEHVYHTLYFQKPRSVDFIRNRLGIK
jgi:hypothetical protein